MKILKTYVDEKLKNKILRVGKDCSFSEEATIKYTGNIRIIRTIFGKTKEQREFYIIKKQWSLWDHNKYKIVTNGPHWK